MRRVLILAGVIALGAGAAPARAQSECGLGASALIESRSELGHGYVFIQRMTLRRESAGSGVDGRWLGTSYESENILPRGVPNIGGMQATESAPGLGVCRTTQPSPQQIRSLCEHTQLSFDVRGGQIYETRSNRRVGSISGPGQSGRNMSLDFMAGTGSPHPPMTGPIQDGAQIQFDVTLDSVGRHPTADASIITLNIRPQTPPPGFTGDVGARLETNAAGHRPQIDVTRQAGGARVQITLLGNARERAETAAATTLIAEAGAAACRFERAWRLDGLLLTLNATP